MLQSFSRSKEGPSLYQTCGKTIPSSCGGPHESGTHASLSNTTTATILLPALLNSMVFLEYPIF